MTLLVTGSAGHLGEALMRHLRAAGRPAMGLDLEPSPFTDCVGSIVDRPFVRQCLAGVEHVLHTATLHKPHLVTHDHAAFLETNVTGTLVLLEEALAAGVSAFVFTSTTSVFGAALRPPPGDPAVWVTESTEPVARNIYGVSKLAAESLCELFARTRGLPAVVLRTSRFFPEADDDPDVRARYDGLNVQANELLHRRVDIEDVVSAHLLALERAVALRFGRYIVSATTPFSPTDMPALGRDAAAVIRRLVPGCEALYTRHGWALPARIDRVYVNDHARADLGWRPKYDFRHVLDSLAAGHDFRSVLAREVGRKGYHGERFEDGLYPIA